MSLIGSSGTALGNVSVGDDNVQVAGEKNERGGGGSNVPAGVGVLSWEVTAGNFVPADNIDARTAYSIVARIAGVSYGAGTRVRVAFTTDGGAPVIGQSAYLASSQDDSSTGRGKATATVPPTTVPPAIHPQIFRQNVVVLGTVVSSTYGVDGNAVIELADTFPIGNTPAADVTWSGARITSLSSANFFDGNGNATQFKMDLGQTLIVLFSFEALTAGTAQDDIISNTNNVPNSGWFLKRNTATNGCVFQWLNATNDGQFAAGDFQALNVFIVTAGPDGAGTNTVWTNFNGNAMTAPIVSAIPVPTAGWKIRMGGGCPGKNGWSEGGFIAAAMLNRQMGTVEMASLAALVQHSDWTPANRYAIPNDVLLDGFLMWSMNFVDWDGVSATVNTSAGPMGSAITLTKEGAPVRGAVSDVWKSRLATLFLDGDVPKYDSRAFGRCEMGARIAFTLTTKWEVWRVVGAVEADDFDDNDNMAIGVFVNGVCVLALPLDGLAAPLDAVAHFFQCQDATLGAGPYTVELVAPDSVARIATFRSGSDFAGIVVPGTAVFQTNATARRLVVVGDGQTLGGHDEMAVLTSPASGAVTTRMRAAYPGRVTALVNTSQGIATILDWGNGSMTPYAKYVASLIPQGAPATKELFVVLGVWDYNLNLLAPAPWGVRYGEFIDALHAASGLAITVAPPSQNNLYATPNIGGHTLQEFVDVVNLTLPTGRPWLTVVDITGPNPVTYAGGGNLQPLVGADQQALADNIQAALGY